MHERRESFIDSDWTILGVTCVGGTLFILILSLINLIVIYFVFRTYFFCFGFTKRSTVFFEYKVKT